MDNGNTTGNWPQLIDEAKAVRAGLTGSERIHVEGRTARPDPHAMTQDAR